MSFRATSGSRGILSPQVNLLKRSLHAAYALVGMTSIFIFLFLIFPTSSHASANFTTDYHVTYLVSGTGVTHAILNIELTNTTTQFYASSYKVQLGFNEINNLKVSDPNGIINPNVNKSKDGYLIDVIFNKRAVGKGSKLPFAIEFDTPSVAKKYGKIWEINIPGIADPSVFSQFTVDIKTPSSFGKPAYIKPKQQTTSLTFNKEQLGKSGISIAFGETQRYAFNLKYHLKNTNLYPTKAEIALPPSTNYQKIFITDINPRPINVAEDKDGNWMAEYDLLSAQKLEITVNGKAEIRLKPDEQPLSELDRATYLEEKLYWPVKSDKIRELADELVTPEAIYAYVVDTLKYDFTSTTGEKNRLGALDALKHPKSVACREFTDLFIAIARAAKIPAREVNGFAYTENNKNRPLSLVKDVLHSWPEYYDDQKKTWVMVDPTWGSTTGGIDYFSVLDFDHFAFVIKGRDGSFPIPAGGYKDSKEKNIKDVQITFAQTTPGDSETFEASTEFSKLNTAGLPITGKVTLINTGSAVVAPKVLQVSSKTLSPPDRTFVFPNIPPFGSVSMDVTFDPAPLLTNSNETLTIRVAEKTRTEKINIVPFFLTPKGGGIIFALFAIILLITTFKSRYLRLSRRAH